MGFASLVKDSPMHPWRRQPGQLCAALQALMLY